GSVAFRESILLRGLVYEQDEVVHFDSDGVPVKITIRGITPSGDSAETFAIDQAMARWSSPVDNGESHYDAGALYYPFGWTMRANDALASSLGKAGQDGRRLLPSGRGWLEPSRTLQVTGPAGEKTVRLHFLRGTNQPPIALWLDDEGKLFGFHCGLGL